MFRTEVVEKIKTHFLFKKIFFTKMVQITWKTYCTAGKTTDDKTAHVHYMVDTYVYKHTLRICNNYCLLDYNNGWTNDVKNILYSWTDHRWQYCACALHGGYISLQTHTQNM